MTDEVFQEIEDGLVLGVFGIGERWEEAEAGGGMAAASGALVEEGAVDFGGDDVVGAAEIEGGGEAEGQGVELRLGELAYVDVSQRLQLRTRG